MSASSGDDPFGHYNDETEVGVGFSDTALLTVSIVGFAVMAFLIYSIIISRVKSFDELEKGGGIGGEGGDGGELDYEEELLRADVASLNRAQRRARAKALMKRERRVAAADGEDEGEADGNNAHDPTQQQQQPNLSRKERQKAAKAAEKKERHLLDEKRREEQRQAMQLAQEEKKKRLEMEAERAREEKIRRQEEQEQRKQQEYNKWNIFLASPDGSVSLTVKDWAKELAQGPNIIPLLDLTTRFDVPIERVKARINELVATGRVTGVLDEERETFYVFTHDNLLSLASYIRNKGEVSLDDISSAAKDLLEPGTS